MDWDNLEDELIDAIQKCCGTEEDKKVALRYFEGTTVNEMIEEALED